VATAVALGVLVLLVAAPVIGRSAPPLVVAARDGDVAAVRAMLEAGASAGAAEPDGTTALHWAARGEFEEIVRLLLDAGAGPDAASRYGMTPLIVASANRSGGATRLLLEAGADPNLANPDGQTPLMTAARGGSTASLAALLEHGAEVNRAEAWFGETALMWAAAENHGDAVTLLAAHGADLNARAKLIELPEVKVDIATMVITALPRGGLTPLLLAAREGGADSARALLEAGADPDLADPDGTSPLVMAIINAHFETASVLAAGGADPDVADAAGMGALYALVDMRTLPTMINRPAPIPTGSIDTLTLLAELLERGADPDLPLSKPLLARQHSNGDGQLGAGSTALMRAAKSVDLPAMRLLLEHGADPAAASDSGATAQAFAARWTPRSGGTFEDSLAALELCLDAGADINAADGSGQTLLHIAASSNDDLVRWLAGRGADLAARDMVGRTPLDVALGVPGPAPAGRGGRGRGGRGGPPEPGPVRESTVALLQDLMREQGLPIDKAPRDAGAVASEAGDQ
jgi:ankyrin repeat protein